MTTPITAPAARSHAPTAPARGRFIWHDLIVPDVEAATHFYQAVAGWRVTPAPMSDGQPPYTMWKNGAVPVGGVMARSVEVTAPAASAYWLAYIATPDLEATYSEALALGARAIVPPRDVALVPPAGASTVGRFAVLADPQGVTFAAYEPADPRPQPGGAPTAGTFSWHELETTDRRAAFAFYAQLFGWAPMETVDMGPNGVYQVFGQGGTAYGGIFDRERDTTAPHWRVYVSVADLTRALGAVRAGGGQVLAGPMAVPDDDCVAHCADPQGARFALHASGPC